MDKQVAIMRADKLLEEAGLSTYSDVARVLRRLNEAADKVAMFNGAAVIMELAEAQGSADFFLTTAPGA